MELSETKLKEKVLKVLKKNFPDTWVYKTADKWKSGIPDLILCKQGQFYAIELKVGKNEATRLQLHTLKKIQLAGGHASVCRTVLEVKNFIKKGGELDGQNRR